MSLRLDNHRIVSNPIEPRGGIGHYDPESGRYTVHVSGQSLHATRDHAARALGIEPSRVRFIAPDVGGGFGAKNFIYPEHVLPPWAAKRLGRPVKWIATRGEVLAADHQGLGQSADAELALDQLCARDVDMRRMVQNGVGNDTRQKVMETDLRLCEAAGA